MLHLASLLILAALASQASEDRHVDAVEIFSCDFAEDWDANFDNWPDQWKRHRGPKWPHYIKIQLEDDSQVAEGRYLSVKLDGGGTQISSPVVSISEKFSYVVETRLRAVRLIHSHIQLRIDFCDEQRQVLESATSPWIQNTRDWTKIHIGPVNIANQEVRFAKVTLVVEPGDHVDLKGKVSLDDVWLARLPRMSVHTNSPFNVYTDPHGVEVTCDLSGILEKDPDIHFELLDASNHTLKDASIQLYGRQITGRISKASDIVRSSKKRTAGYAGRTSWIPSILDYQCFLHCVA